MSEKYGIPVSFPSFSKLSKFKGVSYAKYFYDTLEEHKVSNERHFQAICNTDERFKEATKRIKNLEQAKATIYQSNYNKPYVLLSERIYAFEKDKCCNDINDCEECDNTEGLIGYATALQIVKSIAKENDESISTFLNKIFANLQMESNKKKCIFFIEE